jgi:hypothetical protein
MADTGEDQEIKQRVSAHQAEIVRESKQLEQRTKRGRRKSARRNTPVRSRNAKAISPSQPDPAATPDF